MTGLYLSPSTWHFWQDQNTFGCMLNIVRPIGGQDDALKAGAWWMLDNGQYNDLWTWPLWWVWLNRLLPYQDRCLGIVVSDKMLDAALTIHLFKVFAHIPREMGYKVAFVTQDGMTVDDIPWSLLDTLFIGGESIPQTGKGGRIISNRG